MATNGPGHGRRRVRQGRVLAAALACVAMLAGAGAGPVAAQIGPDGSNGSAGSNGSDGPGGPDIRTHANGAAEVTLRGGLSVTLEPLLVAELDALLLHDGSHALRRAVRQVLRRHAEGDPVMARAIRRYAAGRAPEHAAALRRLEPGLVEPGSLDAPGSRTTIPAARAAPAPRENAATVWNDPDRPADRAVASSLTGQAGADTARTPSAASDASFPSRRREAFGGATRSPDTRAGLDSLTPRRPPPLNTGPLLSSALTTTVVGPSPVASPSDLFFP